jgi:hypothetical protein
MRNSACHATQSAYARQVRDPDVCVCLIVCIIYTVYIIAAKHKRFSRHEQQMSVMHLTCLVELKPTISSTMHFPLPRPVPGSSWPTSRPWWPQRIGKHLYKNCLKIMWHKHITCQSCPRILGNYLLLFYYSVFLSFMQFRIQLYSTLLV